MSDVPTTTTISLEDNRSDALDDNDGDGIVELRIVCLIPSATDICIALGLQSYIVGITHECAHRYFITQQINNNNNNTTTTQGMILDPQHVHVVTIDGINDVNASQATIHELVQQNSQQVQKMSCSRNDNSDMNSDENDDIPTLYPINKEQLQLSNPTLILTQDLCNVCAPNSTTVQRIIQPYSYGQTKIRIVSLSPKSLSDVIQTFGTIATACNIHNKGQLYIHSFYKNIQLLQDTIQKHIHNKHNNKMNDDNNTNNTNNTSTTTKKTKKMLLLEWLDPPFDAGHWILDMMDIVNIQNIMMTSSTNNNKGDNNQNNEITDREMQRKSKVRSWEEIQSIISTEQQQQQESSLNNNDYFIVVACCGFDLQRNYMDTIRAKEQLLQSCPRTMIDNIYVVNGDAYFVNPGPNLLLGITILAQIVYHMEYPDLIHDIQNLPYWSTANISEPYRKVNLFDQTNNINNESNQSDITAMCIPDIEDTNTCGNDDFYTLHQDACNRKAMFYIDPKTKYHVMTEVAHKQRGKCCGSGCRHCPYAHMNVNPNIKSMKIQQPSFLYIAHDNDDSTTNDSYFSIIKYSTNIKVLFFSGGKDSFLTIRALVQEINNNNNNNNKHHFGLVLLTTFDAESRIIAHQDIHIDIVIQQAKHLHITLLGIPMHRGSSESYVDRIRRGIRTIENYSNTNNNQSSSNQTKNVVSTLVFGDLHLHHIKQWRDDALGPLGYQLQYPLFNKPYETLLLDLHVSQVPCRITSTTIEVDDVFDDNNSNNRTNTRIIVGELYDTKFRTKLLQMTTTTTTTNVVDMFGENGEFHTVAEVWKVDRTIALGLFI